MLWRTVVDAKNVLALHRSLRPCAGKLDHASAIGVDVGQIVAHRPEMMSGADRVLRIQIERHLRGSAANTPRPARALH
jgi:hypothetical protein